MIHHRFYHRDMNLIADEIDVSEVALVFAYNIGAQDTFNVTVHPLDLRWGTSISDTGDGTNWVSISVNDHTGYINNANVAAVLQNDTGATRSANVRFYSISHAALDINVTVSQLAEPA